LKIIIKKQSNSDKPLICGGDWNLVLDEKDKKGGSTKLSDP
jgi:exonuclease III